MLPRQITARATSSCLPNNKTATSFALGDGRPPEPAYERHVLSRTSLHHHPAADAVAMATEAERSLVPTQLQKSISR